MEDDVELNFVIDVEPIEDYEAERRKVPLYNIEHDYTSTEKKVEEPKKPRSIFVCWNCGEGGHNLQGCKAPRNHAEVAKNRKAFMENNKRKASDRLAKRYHEQSDQKYSKFKPGVISKSLRKALGIDENQLPRHIYNMRHLGYPPGWLVEAKVLPSSIQMYDGTGERVPEPDDEEGEIDGMHIKYNLDMIIDYPGFNTVPGPDIIEEAHIFNTPLMREDQSKQQLIAKLQHEMKLHANYALSDGSQKYDPDESLEENEDMDMDSEEIPEMVVFSSDEKCAFVPPLPVDEQPLPPPPPGGNKESIKIPSTPKRGNEEDMISPESHSSKSSPYTNLGRVKSVYLGTPVLKGASPYVKLPSYKNFRKGMGEVINFENLPGMTGTYDKMCKVLLKVRESNSGRKSF